MHLNDIDFKIGLFRIYSELFCDYFAILIFFEFSRRRYSVFLQVCTRMTFRFNRLNSTGFISSLKIGMKKMKFWARKKRIGVLGPEKDILEYLENSHHTWTYVNSQKISQKGHLRSITISRLFGVNVTLVIYGLAHLTARAHMTGLNVIFWHFFWHFISN